MGIDIIQDFGFHNIVIWHLYHLYCFSWLLDCYYSIITIWLLWYLILCEHCLALSCIFHCLHRSVWVCACYSDFWPQSNMLFIWLLGYYNISQMSHCQWCETHRLIKCKTFKDPSTVEFYCLFLVVNADIYCTKWWIASPAGLIGSWEKMWFVTPWDFLELESRCSLALTKQTYSLLADSVLQHLYNAYVDTSVTQPLQGLYCNGLWNCSFFCGHSYLAALGCVCA